MRMQTKPNSLTSLVLSNLVLYEIWFQAAGPFGIGCFLYECLFIGRFAYLMGGYRRGELLF